MARHHKCAVEGCDVQIMGHLHFCFTHWSMVSDMTRRGMFRSQQAVKKGTLPESVFLGWLDAAKADIRTATRAMVSA